MIVLLKLKKYNIFFLNFLPPTSLVLNQIQFS